MGRAPCCEKAGLKKGRWTADEDQKLAGYIAQHGEGSWRSLPKNAGLLRCGKSCRLRWMNYLRAGVKRGNISKEEEDTIINLHAALGNRRPIFNPAQIPSLATYLPNRTDNEIKNYWNSHLRRQIHTFRRSASADVNPSTTLPTIDIDKLPSPAGGGTKRSAEPTSRRPVTDRRSHKKPTPPEQLKQQQAGDNCNSSSCCSSGGGRSDGPRGEGESGLSGLDQMDAAGLWEAVDSGEMEAMLLSCCDSAGPVVEAPAAIEDDDDHLLLDVVDWDGLGAQLWGGDTWPDGECDSLLKERDVPGQGELESFERWLMSDSYE